MLFWPAVPPVKTPPPEPAKIVSAPVLPATVVEPAPPMKYRLLLPGKITELPAPPKTVSAPPPVTAPYRVS